MQCPFCSHPDTKVLESRLLDDAMRRRRECFKCENRFTTYERAEFHFTVIKKDGTEQPFNIDKIRASVLKAYGKMEDEELTTITKKIEQRILSKKANPIKTSEIGKAVLRELRRANKIAYLRFATVHKSIQDPKMLEKELQTIV